MKILVTGATGFIGRAATRLLVEKGADVRCLVRPSSDRSVLGEAGVEFAEGDLTDAASLQEALAGCSTVLSLAAETRPVAVGRLNSVNVDGVRELAGLAAAAGVERFVHLSRLSRERHQIYVRRKWARVAVSSLAGEEAVRREISAIVLRSAPCFGPNDHLACPLMARLRRASPLAVIAGQGTLPTQPIWLEDLAECLAATVLEGKADGTPRELAGPREMTVVEFWDKLAAALGSFKVRLHLPETFLRLVGFPLARAAGLTEFLRLAEFFVACTSSEKNFAPALLGRPLVTVEEGIARMLGKSAPAAAGAEA